MFSNPSLILWILIIAIVLIVIIFISFVNKEKRRKARQDKENEQLKRTNDENLITIKNQELGARKFDYKLTGDMGEWIIFRLINEWRCITKEQKQKFIHANPFIYGLIKIVEKYDNVPKEQELAKHVGENTKLHYDVQFDKLSIEVKTSVSKSNIKITNSEYETGKKLKNKFALVIVGGLGLKYDLRELEALSSDDFFEYLSEQGTNLLFFLDWNLLYNQVVGISINPIGYSISFLSYFNSLLKTDPELMAINANDFDKLDVLRANQIELDSSISTTLEEIASVMGPAKAPLINVDSLQDDIF